MGVHFRTRSRMEPPAGDLAPAAGDGVRHAGRPITRSPQFNRHPFRRSA